jgi:hypothetical protein
MRQAKTTSVFIFGVGEDRRKAQTKPKSSFTFLSPLAVPSSLGCLSVCIHQQMADIENPPPTSGDGGPTAHDGTPGGGDDGFSVVAATWRTQLDLLNPLPTPSFTRLIATFVVILFVLSFIPFLPIGYLLGLVPGACVFNFHHAKFSV